MSAGRPRAMGIAALPILVAFGDRLGRNRSSAGRRSDAACPRSELRDDRPPAPVRLRGRRPNRGRLLRGRGLGGARLRALPRRVPADALRVRPDRRQARPERRARRAGDDREADAGRLHHPLQARTSSRADGTVPPVEQVHLHHGTWLSLPATTAAGRSSPPARRRRSRRSRAATACRSRRPTSGCCSTWSTRRCSSRWRSTSPTTSTSSRRPRATRSGIKPAYPVWLDVRPVRLPGVQRPARLRRRGRQVHVAEGGVRRLRPVRQARSSARASPATASARTARCPTRASRSAAIENFTGGTLIGIGGHLHPGGLTNEIDLVRGRRRRKRDLHRRGRATGTATKPRAQAAAARRPRGTSRCGSRAAVLGRPRRARRHPAQQRHLRHDDPVDLREHGHRGRAARARRRRRQARRRPGVDPFTGAGRHARPTATRAACTADAADAVRQGPRHPRPLHGERQLRRARRAQLERARRAEPTERGRRSPTSSTRRAT